MLGKMSVHSKFVLRNDQTLAWLHTVAVCFAWTLCQIKRNQNVLIVSCILKFQHSLYLKGLCDNPYKCMISHSVKSSCP